MSVLTPAMEELFQEPEYRVEGPLKVSGGARYTGDVRLPGMLWARFLLSPYPHARIVSIDTSAAKQVAGVHAVLTSEDIGRRRFGRSHYDWPVLAFDRVLYVGERMAGVAAETREAAEEAVGLIAVEYEELPAVFDVEEALAEGAPLLHPDPSEYYSAGNRPPRPHLNLQSYQHARKGADDIERVFERAHRVFEDVYFGPAQHQGYIEPHADAIWIDPDGTVHVYTTNKAPFSLRHQLAMVTGVEEERIVVDSMFIGGDFGGKGHSIDVFPAYYLAQATGRPVKAVMTYTEELMAADPRHGAKVYMRTGVDRDGRFIAHQARLYYDGGAYAGAKPGGAIAGSPMQVYTVPNTDVENFCVYTNTVPRGNMRAPGATIAALAGEEHVDHIAQELGIDPLEFRILNAIREGDTGPTGVKIKDPRAVAVLELLRRETNWGNRPPLPPNHGRGISLRHRDTGGGRTEILLRLLPEGKIEALYGTPDQGSGSATVVRRLAAAVLSVPSERIVVRYGTTAEAPPDPGAGASRVTNIVGQAVVKGATELKEKLEDLASEVMGWPAGQVHLEEGLFRVAGGSEAASFEEVTARILRGGPIEVTAEHNSSPPGAERVEETSFYAYMIEVEVDPATGQVRPIEAVMVVDGGIVINPIAHRGQLDGGFIYGLGNATMEELVFEDGRVTTASLGEYKLPTEMDVPPLRILQLPPAMGPGPFGAKAVGETINAGVAPAIANAVNDAVGVRIKAMPITAERVFEAIREKQAQGR